MDSFSRDAIFCQCEEFIKEANEPRIAFCDHHVRHFESVKRLCDYTERLEKTLKQISEATTFEEVMKICQTIKMISSR